MVGVRLNGELVGVGVCLTFDDVIYLWYNVDNRKYSNLGIGEYVIWSTIEWAVAKGFRMFDFGGAGRQGQKYGVREFKLAMGGHVVDFGRLICTHNRLKALIAWGGFKVWRRYSRIR